jgi:hypothetical protein
MVFVCHDCVAVVEVLPALEGGDALEVAVALVDDDPAWLIGVDDEGPVMRGDEVCVVEAASEVVTSGAPT